MQRQLIQLWRYLPVRLLVGWLVIVLLPAMWRWTWRLVSGTLIETQSNAMLLATLGVVLATLGLNRLTQFPGQRSVAYIVPTLIGVAVILAAVGVFGTGSMLPDIIVAVIMAGLGLSGGYRVIKKSIEERKSTQLSAAS